MKYLIGLSVVIVFVFLLSHNVFAACSADGLTVVYVNGIFTSSRSDAENDTGNLKKQFEQRSNIKDVKFLTGYNPSHLAGAGDLIESASQLLGSSVSDYDLNTILLQIHPEITTRKIILVGHSQGTFYTNELYNYLVAHGEAKESVGVYNVATPAGSVAGYKNTPDQGAYLTSKNDKVINIVRGFAAKANQPLPANTTIPLTPQEDANTFGGHSFSRVYLTNAPERIVSEIGNALNKLVAAEVPDVSDAGCFTPPPRDFSYRAQELTFAVADPVASGIAISGKAVIAAGEGAYAAVETTAIAAYHAAGTAMLAVYNAIFDTGKIAYSSASAATLAIFDKFIVTVGPHVSNVSSKPAPTSPPTPVPISLPPTVSHAPQPTPPTTLLRKATTTKFAQEGFTSGGPASSTTSATTTIVTSTTNLVQLPDIQLNPLSSSNVKVAPGFAAVIIYGGGGSSFAPVGSSPPAPAPTPQPSTLASVPPPPVPASITNFRGVFSTSTLAISFSWDQLAVASGTIVTYKLNKVVASPSTSTSILETTSTSADWLPPIFNATYTFSIYASASGTPSSATSTVSVFVPAVHVNNFKAVFSTSTLLINFSWNPLGIAHGTTSAITYAINDMSDSSTSTPIAQTTSTFASWPVGAYNRSYIFSIQAFNSSTTLSATSTASVFVPDIIFTVQPLDNKSSRHSHYSDNWYQLGTGFYGTIYGLTLGGGIDDPSFSASHIWLKEFLDKGYSRLNQSFTISDNAPFTSSARRVTISGLKIPLQPNKYYRLDTLQELQNRSVVLNGTTSTGTAMWNEFTGCLGCTSGGRVEHAYSFYPYLQMVWAKNSPPLSPPGPPRNLTTTFDDLNLRLAISWSSSTDPDTLEKLLRYEINISTSSQLAADGWMPVGSFSKTIDVVYSTSTPVSYVIGVRALDDFNSTSTSAIVNWGFPSGFTPSILGNRQNAASQDFVLSAGGNLNSLRVFTSDFMTDSRNSGSNICSADLYAVNETSTVLLAQSDAPNDGGGISGAYAYRGGGCAGTLNFTYPSSTPAIVAGRHYRWLFHFNSGHGAVKFWGKNVDTAGGAWSEGEFLNAKFTLIGTDNRVLFSN